MRMPFRILSLLFFVTASFTPAAAISNSLVQPTNPPSLAVVVQAGKIELPSGTTILVKPATLTVDGPEMRSFASIPDKQGKYQDAPADYAPYYEAWESWPGTLPILHLTPKYDDNGVLILGGLYRSFREETVEVTSADGSQHYKNGVDFVYNPDLGLIANKDGHMKGQVKAKATAGQPRIDLVEVAADGTPRLKKGTTALVCPMIPDADPGCVPVAGVYIAPWTVARSPFYIDKTPPKTASEYAVTANDIYPVHADVPSHPIMPENIAKSLAKLRQGQPLTIAFMGDSITLGAEAAQWYGPDPYGPNGKTFRGKFVYGLKTRFPASQIKTVDAFEGGTGIDYGLAQYEKTVAPAKPDLVLIGFGTNDAGGPIVGPAKTPIDKFTASLDQIVAQAKKDGAEVIIVLPEPTLPWSKNHQSQRLADYRKAMLDVAQKEGASVVAFNAEVENLANHGMPTWSQLHNWINHPGDYMHSLFADALLRFFPTADPGKTSSGAQSTPPTIIPMKDGLITQPQPAQGSWKVAPQVLPPVKQITDMTPDDRPLYGVYCWPSEYLRYHDLIKKIGWTSLRLGGPMSDDAMKLCAQDNIEVMECLSGSPQPGLSGVQAGNRAAYDSDDAFIAGYIKMVNAYLERWGPGGTYFKEHPEVPNHPVLHIEVFNEPNFFYLDQKQWTPSKDEADRIATETRREKLYAQLLPAAYKAIKSRWPEVQVVGFGAGGSSAADTRFIQHVHEDNPAVAKSYDILSTHPYNNGGPPEENRVAPWGEFSIANSLAEIRATMKKFGTSDKPIWYSELNWEIGPEEGGHYGNDARHEFGGDRLSQLLQAAYLVRGYAWTARLGVRRLDYMSLIDTDLCNSGLMSTNGVWRLSAHAVQTMIQTLPHPVLLGAIFDGDDGNYIYRFSPFPGAKDEVIMAWRSQEPKTVKIPWSKGDAEEIDMLGNRRLVSAQNGTLEMEIGPCPIYLVPATK